jgi:DNA-binding response OmpR family regulator
VLVGGVDLRFFEVDYSKGHGRVLSYNHQTELHREEVTEMQQVLLACADKGLRDSFRLLLDGRGLAVHWVTSGENALRYIQEHDVDLVILHSDAADQDCCTILEVLRSFRPNVSIILTSSHFDYWNNFMTWLADECLVTTPDLVELGDKVDELLGLKGDTALSTDKSNFTVDWE